MYQFLGKKEFVMYSINAVLTDLINIDVRQTQGTARTWQELNYPFEEKYASQF